MKPDCAYVKKLVEKGSVVMTHSTEYTPSKSAVDGPVMGNGDMGAVIRTESDGYVFLLGKNDFWRQPQLYETPEQQKERLLNETCRRTGGRPIPAGWMRLRVNGLQQTRFHMEQSIYDAQIKLNVDWYDGQLLFNRWICAVQNTLVVEVENTAFEDARMDLIIMPGEFDVYEVTGYDDGYTKDSVWFTYGAEPYNVPGRRVVAAAATVDTDVAYEPDRMAYKGGLFNVGAHQKQKILLTLLSDLDAKRPKEQAIAVNKAAMQDTAALWEQHTAWWRDFWEKSAVETGNETLDSYYYSSLYWLGCCMRRDKVPPSLYGCWTTSDFAMWSGAYTLNYNYESPFFCLYTSNREDLVRSYIQPLLDIIPIGEMFAREKFGQRGICLPVEIGPFGTVCSGNFFHQKNQCCKMLYQYFHALFFYI